jgi:hypothetical protein
MQENNEQRYAIKLCVKLNKSATETFASLTQAYGDTTLLRIMVFKLHKAFKEGRKNVEDEPRSGRLISSTNDENVEVVRAVMVKDRRLSIRMIAEETGLDKCILYSPQPSFLLDVQPDDGLLNVEACSCWLLPPSAIYM